MNRRRRSATAKGTRSPAVTPQSPQACTANRAPPCEQSNTATRSPRQAPQISPAIQPSPPVSSTNTNAPRPPAPGRHSCCRPECPAPRHRLPHRAQIVRFAQVVRGLDSCDRQSRNECPLSQVDGARDREVDAKRGEIGALLRRREPEIHRQVLAGFLHRPDLPKHLLPTRSGVPSTLKSPTATATVRRRRSDGTSSRSISCRCPERFAPMPPRNATGSIWIPTANVLHHLHASGRDRVMRQNVYSRSQLRHAWAQNSQNSQRPI